MGNRHVFRAFFQKKHHLFYPPYLAESGPGGVRRGTSVLFLTFRPNLRRRGARREAANQGRPGKLAREKERYRRR
jgi:hypothetical protein